MKKYIFDLLGQNVNRLLYTEEAFLEHHQDEQLWVGVTELVESNIYIHRMCTSSGTV